MTSRFSKYIVYIHLFLVAGCVHSKKDAANIYSSSNESGLADSLRHFIEHNSKIIAFTNANIIDGTGMPIRKNQTVIIEDGYFKDVGNVADLRPPKGSEIIDLKGKTIIPGIIGMHNHLHIPGFPNVGDIAAKLYLASGVTTIQTCGAASPLHEIELSRNIEMGHQMGPDIIPSAPFITSEGGNTNMIIAKDEQHLKDTMQHWIAQGVQWFKVYRNISPKDLKVVIDEAHKHGCKVRGHLCSITFEEAAAMGIDGIEHGLNSTSDFRTNKEVGACNGGREYMDELIINSNEVRSLQQIMIDNNIFLTSTLSIFEASIPNRAFADERSLNAMTPYLKNQYDERRIALDKQADDSIRNKRLKRIMQFEYQYYKMGGLLCSGVDAGRHVLPGFGDQRNYELLIEAGFAPEEAIQVMTGNGAEALGRTDIGTIQKGKRADFVILDGNLENEPSIIEKVESVFKNGVGYSPVEILKETKERFGAN